MTPDTMPALFVGHGSPMNAIEDNIWTQTLLAWGRRLPKPKAVLCISAHWLTDGTFVTAAGKPRMIYDMHGFPPELYKVQYPAPGDPFLAKKIHDQFPFIQLDNKKEKDLWGFDHGAWSVLKFLFPAADVPVLQLSIDFTQNASFHFELGQKISLLRQQGVMIIGSGNIVHNLRAISMNVDAQPFAWALEFDLWFKKNLQDNTIEPLLYEYNHSDAGRKSVPTPDHYFPALYIAGARLPGDQLQFECEAIQHGSLAMRSFSFA
jgi:4,5-DOPA dioxygenase extradiol